MSSPIQNRIYELQLWNVKNNIINDWNSLLTVSHFQFSNNVAVVELTIEVVEMVDSVALAIAEDTVDDVTAAVVEFDTGSQ